MNHTQLIERLRKAEGPDRELDIAIEQWSGVKATNDACLTESMRHGWFEAFTPLYTASIDASLSLVKRLLPGAMWCTGSMEEGPFCRLLWPDATGSFGGNYVSDYAASAPIAILIAALTALQARSKE